MGTNVKPPFKWVGGKRQLLPELLPRVPKKYAVYHEPFLGGGALFFALAPARAHISDINSELINAYSQIRDNVELLIEELKEYKNTEEFYYEIREVDRQFEYQNWTDVKRAARFIYLNKTCFNGLYRVNSSGYFNVPYGKYANPKILDEENLKFCCKALSPVNVVISQNDYLHTIKSVKEDDFVYLDPPYIPLNVTSSFTMYSKDGFDMIAHKNLLQYCEHLDSLGVKWMQSNSSAPIVYEMYTKYHIDEVNAKRSVSATVDGRAAVKEVIIRNYQ